MIIHKFTEIIGAFDALGVPALGFHIPSRDPLLKQSITYVVITALLTKKELRTFPATDGDFLIFQPKDALPQLPRDERVWGLIWQARNLLLRHDERAELLLACTRRGLRKLVANIGPQETFTITLPDGNSKVRAEEMLLGEPQTQIQFIGVPTRVREKKGAPAWELLHMETGMKLYPQGRHLMGRIWDDAPFGADWAAELLAGANPPIRKCQF